MKIKGNDSYILCFKSFNGWATVSKEHFNFADETKVVWDEIGEVLAEKERLEGLYKSELAIFECKHIA